MSMAGIVCLDDFEALARETLPHAAYEYIASGAADEHTLCWNREAWDRILLKPRVLAVDTPPDTSVELLGITLPHPILLAPAAYQRAFHPEGELAAARGAGAAGAVYVASTSTTTPIEEIAIHASGPLWHQLYIQPDRDWTKDLIQRVEAAGCRALCITVDSPVLGARDRQRRCGFTLPDGLETPHLYDAVKRRTPGKYLQRKAITWADIEWVRSLTNLPIVLKGILNPDDAEIAISAGAEAVIVSNHGGRNLDTVPATAEVLPVVAERIGGRVAILVDGGIRRGTDVLKAAALGASAVLIGRPYLYALAACGEEGVRHCVDIIRNEFEMAMALTGCANIAGISEKALW